MPRLAKINLFGGLVLGLASLAYVYVNPASPVGLRYLDMATGAVVVAGFSLHYLVYAQAWNFRRH